MIQKNHKGFYFIPTNFFLSTA